MSIEARFKVQRDNFCLDVDLELPGLGVSALYGPSGCGKTTLLRAIAGLEHHRQGYLKTDGIIWQDDHEFIPPHRRQLGYVFQEASLFEHLDVRGNLQYGEKRAPKNQRKFALDKAIELLGIGQFLDRWPAGLSGGERQRVAIARALAVSPSLLLMDEPLASLDVNRKQEILPYIESLHRELDIPVIYVSHSPEEVARLADHLVLLEAGRVSASGSIASMLTRLDLELARGSEAGALIKARVAGHDESYHLTQLDSTAGRFTVIRQSLPVGSEVRLRVAARDVSLILSAPLDTSISNIFPATVEGIIPEGQAQVTVRLKCGEVFMLARITRKSADELELETGKPVYAQVKSVALLS